MPLSNLLLLPLQSRFVRYSIFSLSFLLLVALRPVGPCACVTVAAEFDEDEGDAAAAATAADEDSGDEDEVTKAGEVGL